MKWRLLRTVIVVLSLPLILDTPVRGACVPDVSTNGQADVYRHTSSLLVHLPPGAKVGDECTATIWGYTIDEPLDISSSVPPGWTVQWCVSAGSGGIENICFATYYISGRDSNPTFTARYKGGHGDRPLSGGAEVDCGTGCSGIDSGTSSNSYCKNLGSGSGCSTPAITLADAGDLVIGAASAYDLTKACSSAVSWKTVTHYTTKTSCAAGGNSPNSQYGWGSVFDQAFSSSGNIGSFGSSWGHGNTLLTQAVIAMAPGTPPTPTPTATPTPTTYTNTNK